ncbi:hypothetical protein F511_06709 [Dorcoceras hygrometricum]|uniref:Uncharacterized protein n=1 Tax=Dorcoceras hygrometricum TaxID=472368 RepID=A0A2Z7BD37_9LAMI|nr:hypothetical protein F511_06709 [Dorcoceras hygrometricum]
MFHLFLSLPPHTVQRNTRLSYALTLITIQSSLLIHHLPTSSISPPRRHLRDLKGIQLAVSPKPLWLRNHNSGPAQRIMVKRLAKSPHDPLGITDSAYKNQSVVVSVQYGPFNPYIPIRSTTIDSIGYPRMSASGESSTTMHRIGGDAWAAACSREGGGDFGA